MRRPTRLSPILAALLALWPLTGRAANATAVSAIESYGSFETAGVWITLSGDDNGDAVATATVQGPADPSPRPVHPLARFDGTHLATSLFGLQPGTTYTVRVTVSDPDGVTGGSQQV